MFGRERHVDSVYGRTVQYEAAGAGGGSPTGAPSSGGVPKMQTQIQFFIAVWLKFFFIFTPFFALSMFLSLTGDYTERRRRRLALMISLSVAVLCLALLFLGRQIFDLFGITLNAFRVGVGALLFLSSVSLVHGRKTAPETQQEEADIAVVPLAMPVIVGPATTGTLLVMGAGLDQVSERFVASLALLLAVACVGVMLLLGTAIERGIGQRGLNILSKVTGIVLAALAAQMILDGVSGYIAAQAAATAT